MLKSLPDGRKKSDRQIDSAWRCASRRRIVGKPGFRSHPGFRAGPGLALAVGRAMIVGYARVSTREQCFNGQLASLTVPCRCKASNRQPFGRRL